MIERFRQPNPDEVRERAERLLRDHLARREIFTFFGPGEERQLAHHQSQREPAAVYRDAEPSPYFCSLRTPDNKGGKTGNLTSEAVALIGEVLLDSMLLNGTQPYRIAGIPNAGDPIAEAIVAAAAGRGVTIRRVLLEKFDGEHGREFRRADRSDTEDIDVLVDDLLTLGDVKLRALQAVRRADGSAPPLYVLLDRQEGGYGILENLSILLLPVYTVDEAFVRLLRRGDLSAGDMTRMLEYASRRRALIAAHMPAILEDLRTNP